VAGLDLDTHQASVAATNSSQLTYRKEVISTRVQYRPANILLSWDLPTIRTRDLPITQTRTHDVAPSAT